MSEILYRAKAINRDNGYYRTSYKNGDWVYGLITRLYDERFEAVPAEMKNTNCVSGIEVDYRTIGQYTGCCDKSKTTEVFEGDIVWDEIDEQYGVVEFDEGEFYVNFDGIVDCARFADVIHCCYVVGNIHDNPELLKGDVNNDR